MSDIEKFRGEIDGADEKLLQALAERMDIAAGLGRYKKNKGMELRDDERFDAMLADRIKQGVALGLPEELITVLYETIHEATLDHEAEA